jgi:hypothetical protein
MLVGWPGAAQDRLPAGCPDTRRGCRGVPRGPARDAELLALRHENAVLRRHAGRVRYESADWMWCAALARLIPRRRWAEIFPVTPRRCSPGTANLAANKYDIRQEVRGLPETPLLTVDTQYSLKVSRRYDLALNHNFGAL